MMVKKLTLPVAIFFLFGFGIQAQKVPLDKTGVSQIKERANKLSLRSDSSIAFVELREDYSDDAQKFILKNKTALGLNNYSSLISFDSKKDKLGITSTRYKQFYKGIEVIGAVSIFHQRNGKLKSMNGRIVPNIQLDVLPTISKQVALQIALDHINANFYRWEQPGQEDFEPKGELKISSKNYSFRPEKMRLVYQFDIYAMEPLGRYITEIDAKTGEVVNQYDRIHHHTKETVEQYAMLDIAASGESWYNGNVNFTADEIGINTFMLRSTAKNITTRSLRGGQFQSGAQDVFSSTSVFSDPNDKEAVSVHRATEASYDYFFEKFGASGYNNGTSIVALSNYGTMQENAFWDGTAFYYGDGLNFGAGHPWNVNPLVTLDIVGHEYTHAITFFSGGLVYQNESGALNESFSDIFGHNIEVYKNPTGWSWSNGSEVFPLGGSYREFNDPKARQQPDTYLGDFWHTGPGDNGGVHVNSGVMNYWYYLLTDGGSGENDKGFQYNVMGIGLDKAAEIAYRNLTTYITSTSQHSDARLGAEQATIDLYGNGSQEHQSVMAAWDAVGVPAQTPLAYANPSLNFEQVYTTFTKTLEVPVLNMGLGDLSVTNITIDNNLFTVDQTTFTIGGNGSDTLKITYTPMAVQSDLATMSIVTDVNTVTVDITGSGIDFPIAGVNPSSLSATVESGNTVSQPFGLSNTGLGNLNWSATAQTPLSLDVTTGDIGGGNATQINVTADATGIIAGNYSFDVNIVTNDSAAQQIIVPFSLEVTASPALTVASTIDLATVYTGVNFSRTLLIQNTGYDTLKISDIQLSIPEIEIEENTAINIPAQSSEKITILYKNLPVGSLTATMTFSGNFTSSDVVITGNVLSNPLSIAQDTVKLTLNSGDDGIATLDLANLLTQSLEIDIIPSDTFRTSTMGILPIETVTQAAMLRSWDLTQLASHWTETSNNFGDVEIDLTTLNKSDITYQDLQNSGADVLIVPNTFFLAYSETEIDAIIQYTNEGHGLIMYYGVLGFQAAHNRFAPLFGLSKNATYQHSQSHDQTSVPVRNHELFENLTPPLITSSFTVSPTIPWEDVNLQGEVIARSNDEKAIVVRNFNRIYYSDWRNNSGNSFESRQFMRNAIRMANKSIGTVAADLATATMGASGNKIVNLTVKTRGLINDDYLYYVNIYETASDQLIGRVPVKLEVTSPPKLVASSALLFDDTEIGKSNTKSLLIQNDSGADLVINDLVFDGTTFSTNQELPFMVAPYQSANLDLTFKPSTSGSITETLTLLSNDLTTPSHAVSLTGTGLEVPHLLVGVDTIRITLKQGTSISQSISLQNLGAVDLNWSSTTSFGEVVDEIDLPDFFIDNWYGVTYLNDKIYVGHRNQGNFYTIDPFTKQIDLAGTINKDRIGRMSSDGTNIYVGVPSFGTYVYNTSFQLVDYFAYAENNFVPVSLRNSKWWSGPDWQNTANELYEFDLDGNKLATYTPTGTTHVYAMDWLDNDNLLVIDKAATYNLKQLSFDGSQFTNTSGEDIVMPAEIRDLEIQAPYLWAINKDNKLYQIHFSDNFQISTPSGTISSGGSASIDYSIVAAGLVSGVYPFHLNISSNDPNAVTRIPVELTIIENTGANLPPLISLSDMNIPEDGSMMIDFKDHISDENSTLIIAHSVISAQSNEMPGITTNDLNISGLGPVTIQPGPGINGVFEIQVDAQDSEGNTSSAIFKVNVLPVNDAPSFIIGSDQTVAVNAGLQTISGFATSISDNDHGSQNLEFVETNDNPGLFEIQPRIDTNGTLTYKAVNVMAGQANVNVLLRDDGGAAFNGQFESNISVFKISVQAPIIWNGINWSNVSGPTGTDNVRIEGDYTFSINGIFESNNLSIQNGVTMTVDDDPGNGSVLVVNGSLHSEGLLHITSGASLMTLGAVTGTGYQIDRTTTFDSNTGRYSIVGSPVQNESFTTLGANAVIYGYDPSELYNPTGNQGLDRFKTPTQLSQSTMNLGQGYFSAFTGDNQGLVQFSGTPNTGTINIPLAFTDHAPVEETVFEGFNLVSNPYPSAIDFTTFMNVNSSNINGSIYLWDDNNSEAVRGDSGDYVIVNALGNTDSRNNGLTKWDGSIRSGQGFFVQTGSLTNLSFDNSMRILGNNDDGGFYRIAQENTSIKLLLTNSNNQKATVIGFASDATTEVDKHYDAISLSVASLQLFSMAPNDSNKMGIQGLPTGYNDEINLGFMAEAGEYNISITNIKDIGDMRVILIKDHLTNRTVNLKDESYSFITPGGENKNRFTLRVSESVINNMDHIDDQVFYIHSTVGQLNIVFETVGYGVANFKLIDMTGKTVYEESGYIRSNKYQMSTKKVQEGIYILVIRNTNEIWKKKVIIR